ncbi:MAG: DNA polymerase, partial [Minisyncoccia bacterium]
MKLVVDFETRSMADLKKSGAPRYAQDPTTEVLCLSYGWEDGDDVYTWFPGDPLPVDIEVCIRSCDGKLVAHKASFEKWIWRSIMVPEYGWPDVPDEQWEDTLAMAAYRNLPQALD